MARRFRDTTGKRTISAPEFGKAPVPTGNRIRAGIPVLTPEFIQRYFTNVDDTTDYVRLLSDSSLVLTLVGNQPIQIL